MTSQSKFFVFTLFINYTGLTLAIERCGLRNRKKPSSDKPNERLVTQPSAPTPPLAPDVEDPSLSHLDLDIEAHKEMMKREERRIMIDIAKKGCGFCSAAIGCCLVAHKIFN